MHENSLHLALKDHFSGDSSQQEAWVDGYCIDVVQDDLLIEVQTRSFSSIKSKLSNLLPNHPILLVHPIPVCKWIVYWPAEGETPISRRKSPRRGRAEHIFNELVRFPDYIQHPNLSICLVFTHEEEIRRQDGLGSWRRKGASIANRTLLKVLNMQVFSTPADFLDLLPDDLESPFTNRQLAKASGIRIELARKMSYCLRQMQMLEVHGKRQRELLFKPTQAPTNIPSPTLNGATDEQ